jgi:hypothetical protein
MNALNKLVTEKVNSIIGRERARATVEVKKKLRAFGPGIAMLVVASVLVVFGLGLALATIAAALATVFSTWLALLIVTGGVFAIVGVLVGLGIHGLSKQHTPEGELAPSPRS